MLGGLDIGHCNRTGRKTHIGHAFSIIGLKPFDRCKRLVL